MPDESGADRIWNDHEPAVTGPAPTAGAAEAWPSQATAWLGPPGSGRGDPWPRQDAGWQFPRRHPDGPNAPCGGPARDPDEVRVPAFLAGLLVLFLIFLLVVTVTAAVILATGKVPHAGGFPRDGGKGVAATASPSPAVGVTAACSPGLRWPVTAEAAEGHGLGASRTGQL